jgi:hypothetical protein
MLDCRRGIARDAAARQGLPTSAGRYELRTTVIIIILSFVTATGFSQASSSPQSGKPADQTQAQGQVPEGPEKPPDQTKPPDTKPEQQSQSVKAQAANVASNAALQPVKLFNLLEKKSIVFPDIAASTTALTPGQKFELFVDNSVSVHIIAWSLTGSAFAQAADSPTGFQQGWAGYGERFGASLARYSSGQFFGTFILASSLHEDPRFFPEYNLTFKQSIKYSFRCLFISRNDQGEWGKNISGLGGPLLGEALANVYWPDRNRTVGDTFFRYGVDLASRAAGNMFRQYWPRLFAKMQQHAPAQQGDAH